MNKASSKLLSPNKGKYFKEKIVAWFRKNGRVLPWRKTRDPYKILISEIMLQQTQVSRVTGFFKRFIRELPTIQDLAAASEKKLKALWKGLGYNRRVLNLQKTARLIVEKHGGVVPSSRPELTNLPGIGEYTAGAVLSFAFNKEEAIVDVNVIRIIQRFFLKQGLQLSPGKLEKVSWKLSWDLVKLPLSGIDPWTFNQAILDFGALICVPVTPKCKGCPIFQKCRYFKYQIRYIKPLSQFLA